MNKRAFERQYLCEFAFDPFYEVQVQAWVAYHLAADNVDNYWFWNPPPGRLKLAKDAGLHAMRKILPDAKLSGDKIWNQAKMEALRRLERNPYVANHRYRK